MNNRPLCHAGEEYEVPIITPNILLRGQSAVFRFYWRRYCLYRSIYGTNSGIEVTHIMMVSTALDFVGLGLPPVILNPTDLYLNPALRR